jgi:hypothetical protein
MSSNLVNPEAFSPAEASELQSILTRLAALESDVASLKTAPVSSGGNFVKPEQLAEFGIHL